MDDLPRYSELKTLGLATVEALNHDVVLSLKRFDPMTGQQVPASSIVITSETISQLISEYQTKISSLQTLLGDVEIIAKTIPVV